MEVTNYQKSAFLNKALSTLHEIKVTALQSKVDEDIVESVNNAIVCCRMSLIMIEENLRKEVYEDAE